MLCHVETWIGLNIECVSHTELCALVCVCWPCSYLPGVHDAAKQHLQQLEGSRKLFVAATSLSIAQRQLLYAHDELSMALLRITTRRDGEQVGVGDMLSNIAG